MTAPTDLCRESLRLIDEALRKPPLELEEELDEAERLVVQLRDELMASQHASLERVNVALSLMVGVEYPATGIKQQMLKQARDTLQSACDSGL